MTQCSERNSEDLPTRGLELLCALFTWDTMHNDMYWAYVGHHKGFVASLPLMYYMRVTVSVSHREVFHMRYCLRRLFYTRKYHRVFLQEILGAIL